MSQRPSQCRACGCFSACLSPYDPRCDEHAETHAQVSESSDSEPHVHKVVESMPWWAKAFEQWKGKTNG